MPKIKNKPTKAQQKMMDRGKTLCPYCHADMDGESIFDAFKKKRDAGEEYYRNKTDKEIEMLVTSVYGPPYRWSRQIGIEYQGCYDGILRWKCPDCKGTWDRFTSPDMAYYYAKLPQNVVPGAK